MEIQMNIIELHFLIILLKALVLTITIEILALLIQREKTIKIYFLSIIINIFTNISFNFAIQVFPLNNYYIIVLEIIIVIIEFLCYYVLIKDIKRAIRISFICNLLSYFIGVLLIPYIY